MRVIYDDQVFNWQRRGGISRYFLSLVSALETDDSLGVEVVLPRYWTRNERLLSTGRGRPLPGRRGPVPRFLNRGRASALADLRHTTYYDERSLSKVRHVPHVVTVYDMIPERFPELFPRGNPHTAKERYVKAADLVLCISNSTRDDLLHFYGEPNAPVVVTRLGVDPVFSPRCERAAVEERPYVLFVGDREGYKDFDVCVNAFARSELPEDVQLVCIGGGRWTKAELLLFSELNVEHRVTQRNLSDDELARAYSRALCFVFPSRYEGFGLPILEAMACGCPVLIARGPAQVEVAGTAAAYFAPGDADEMALLISRISSDRSLAAGLQAEGLRRASHFTWAATARTTALAYRSIL